MSTRSLLSGALSSAEAAFTFKLSGIATVFILAALQYNASFYWFLAWGDVTFCPTKGGKATWDCTRPLTILFVKVVKIFCLNDNINRQITGTQVVCDRPRAPDLVSSKYRLPLSSGIRSDFIIGFSAEELERTLLSVVHLLHSCEYLINLFLYCCLDDSIISVGFFIVNRSGVDAFAIWRHIVWKSQSSLKPTLQKEKVWHTHHIYCIINIVFSIWADVWVIGEALLPSTRRILVPITFAISPKCSKTTSLKLAMIMILPNHCPSRRLHWCYNMLLQIARRRQNFSCFSINPYRWELTECIVNHVWSKWEKVIGVSYNGEHVGNCIIQILKIKFAITINVNRQVARGEFAERICNTTGKKDNVINIFSAITIQIILSTTATTTFRRFCLLSSISRGLASDLWCLRRSHRWLARILFCRLLDGIRSLRGFGRKYIVTTALGCLRLELAFTIVCREGGRD